MHGIGTQRSAHPEPDRRDGSVRKRSAPCAKTCRIRAKAQTEQQARQAALIRTPESWATSTGPKTTKGKPSIEQASVQLRAPRGRA